MNGLLTVLYESAAAAVRVRREYAKRRRAYNEKYFTYALLLRHGKIYVGNTGNIYQRLLEHKLVSSSSSLWVKEHGPVERILEITVDAPAGAEADRTFDYMATFGWEAVRGASWCRTEMRNPPRGLAAFDRGGMAHKFMSRADIDDVEAKVDVLVAEMRGDDDDPTDPTV